VPRPLVNPIRTLISELIGEERLAANDDPVVVGRLIMELLRCPGSTDLAPAFGRVAATNPEEVTGD